MKVNYKELKEIYADNIELPDEFLANIEPDKKNGYYEDKKRAKAVIDWIENYCILTSAEWYGEPFKLMDWQKAVIRPFYGFVRKEKFRGKQIIVRQYSTLFINIPKKNGKSQFAAALALYHLVADGEKTPEVYSLAFDERQSRIVYDDVVRMVSANPIFKEENGIFSSQNPFQITNPANIGIFRPLSSTKEGKQGFKPSCTITDECHEFKDLQLYDSITSYAASSNRQQPVKIIITTAGVDETGITRKLVERGLRIQHGEVKDPLFLPAIWKAKSFDPITAKEIFKIVNPSHKYGLTSDKMYHAQEVEMKYDDRKKQEIKAYHFNIAIRKGGAKQIIPMKKWEACETNKDIRWVFQQFPTFGGLDYAALSDFLALSFIAFNPFDKKLYIEPHTWITETEIEKQRKFKHVFRQWQDAGYFEPDKMDEFDPDILPEILREKAAYYPNLKQLGYDRFSILHQMKHFDETVRYDCIDIPNSHMGLSEATKRFIALIHAERIVFRKNDLLTYCAENTYAEVNKRRQYMLDKSSKEQKIDPIVAIIIAFDCLLRYQVKVKRTKQQKLVTIDRTPLFSEETWLTQEQS